MSGRYQRRRLPLAAGTNCQPTQEVLSMIFNMIFWGIIYIIFFSGRD